MEQLGEELKKVILDSGMDLVGYADLKNVKEAPFRTGVIIALRQPVVGTWEETHHDLIRARLGNAVQKGTDYLESKGYQVLQQGIIGNRLVPHKTIGTLAGLGWIGKNCLLITREYGPGVRLASFFTDAPLPYGTPILESRCGNCTACVDACPGKALKGALWKAGMEQKELLDVATCRETRDKAWSSWDKPYELSEKCISACPYTR